MAKQWHGGKGSDPRPVDNDKYRENWDKIFNNEYLDNPLEGDGNAKSDVQTDKDDV